MDYMELILGFAVITVTASNVLKALVSIYHPDGKTGLAFSILFGIWASVGYGTGILGMVFQINYNEVLFPVAFQYFDLISSGLLYTLGSKIITDVVEVIAGKFMSSGVVLPETEIEEDK